MHPTGTSPYHKSMPVYVLYAISATSRTQRLYRTNLESRESRDSCTVGFADRVSHSVDRPRASLHVSLARSSAQLSQSPEQSVPPMHAVISELTQLNSMQ